MITPDSPYFRQVQLLVRVLPFIGEEDCFALKGGTAINLFLRDLPRLSVDIDLAFLPVTDFPTARRQIAAALDRIRGRLTAGSACGVYCVCKSAQQTCRCDNRPLFQPLRIL